MGLFRPLIGSDLQILEVMVKKDRLPGILTLRDLVDLLVWVDFPDHWKKAAEEPAYSEDEFTSKSERFLNKIADIYYEKIKEACSAGRLSAEVEEVEDWTGSVIDSIYRIRIEYYCKYDPEASFCKLLISTNETYDKPEDADRDQEERWRWPDKIKLSRIKTVFAKVSAQEWDKILAEGGELNYARAHKLGNDDEGEAEYYTRTIVNDYLEKNKIYTVAQVTDALLLDEFRIRIATKSDTKFLATKQQQREAVLSALLETLNPTTRDGESPVALNMSKVELVGLLNQANPHLFPTVEGYDVSPYTFDQFWETQRICTLNKA